MRCFEKVENRYHIVEKIAICNALLNRYRLALSYQICPFACKYNEGNTNAMPCIFNAHDPMSCPVFRQWYTGNQFTTYLMQQIMELSEARTLLSNKLIEAYTFSDSDHFCAKWKNESRWQMFTWG